MRYREAEYGKVLGLPAEGVHFQDVGGFLYDFAVVIGVVLFDDGFQLVQVAPGQPQVYTLSSEILPDAVQQQQNNKDCHAVILQKLP